MNAIQQLYGFIRNIIIAADPGNEDEIVEIVDKIFKYNPQA